MKTRASMERRDMATICVLVLGMAAFLCVWSPSLRPAFIPMRATPPVISYCPALLTTSDHQEYYDEWNAVHSPALIALSATMMLFPDKYGPTDAIAPPVDAAARLTQFPDISPAERQDTISILTPSRPMTTRAPQSITHPLPQPAGIGHGSQQRSPAAATKSYRMDLTGNWQNRSVDITPMLALQEPSGPWSFTAILRYDEIGRVQHALLESVGIDQPLRDEIARRLYQCRITPGRAPGEGRLTLSGPGRASRQ